MRSQQGGPRVGAQHPTFLHKPQAKAVDHSDAEDYADLAAAYGLVADEWQLGVLAGFTARGEDGQLVASRVGLSVPRQNGKNGVLEIFELGQMVLDGRRILHTAHEVKTGRKAFVRLSGFFQQYPALKGMVQSIRSVNGQEAIFLKNGGSCEFIARSKSSGRGFSVDTLVMDEAQQLTDEALEALLPTISAGPAGDPQQVFTGTPPDPTSAYGEVFRRAREAAHDGSATDLWWAEWSVPTSDGVAVDADDVDLWYMANPALGTRISEKTVASERAAMADISFRRERLGVWEAEQIARVLPLEDWQACADSTLTDDSSPVVLGVDISPDRDSASIVACGETEDGHYWVDVVENRRGTPDWVIPRLQAILSGQTVDALLIDVLSPAGSLIEPLESLGIRVSKVGSRIMAGACGQFYDLVMSHQLRHLDQVSLNLAAGMARKRKLADAWAWNRASQDADITPLVAATLALTGRTYTRRQRPVKPEPRVRKVVVW